MYWEFEIGILWMYVLVFVVIIFLVIIKWFCNMLGRRRVWFFGRFLEGVISKYIMIRVEKICFCDFVYDDWRIGNFIVLNMRNIFW